MEDICRVCMSSSVTLMDMFAKRATAFDSEPSLVQKIMECARCDILENDNLPQKICISCILNAESAFKFKTTCEQSQLILSSMMKENTYSLDQIIKIETPEIILGQESEITIKKEPKIVSKIALEQKANENFVALQKEEETLEIDSLEHQLPIKAVAKLKSTKQSQKTKVKESKVKNIRQTVICSTKATKKRKSKTLPTETQTEFGEFQCAQCLKIVGSANALRLHRLVHISERPHECPHCMQRFTRKGDLRAHIRIHTGERPYKCEHCSRTFVQATHLSQHKRTHTGDFHFKCPHCSAKFVKQGNLKCHLAFHTNPQLKEVENLIKNKKRKGRSSK